MKVVYSEHFQADGLGYGSNGSRMRAAEFIHSIASILLPFVSA